MHLLRTTRRAGYLFAAGAATAYFLDPDAGPARRARVIDQIRGLVPERDELADLASEQQAAPSAPSAPSATPGSPLVDPAPGSEPAPVEDVIHIDGEQMTDGSGEAFPQRMESQDLDTAEIAPG